MAWSITRTVVEFLLDIILAEWLAAVHRSQLGWHIVLRALWWSLLLPLALLCYGADAYSVRGARSSWR